jgi:hypothetical protein
MAVTIYTVLLLTCSVALCLFGFFVGRCARKIPILDEHLPRALHRGETPPHNCQSCKEPAKDATNYSDEALWGSTNRARCHSNPRLGCDPSIPLLSFAAKKHHRRS